MKKKALLIGPISAITVACVMLAACPNNNQVKQAADAVNRYGTTLSSLQDAEIQLHSEGKVPDDLHVKILNAEKVAAKAGHDMDAGIEVASKGNDPSQYTDVASQTFQDLVNAIKLNPQTQQGLQLAITTADAALKNAITMIQQLRASKPSPATPAPTSPSGLAIWLLVAGLFPMMAAGGDINVTIGGAVKLLNLIMELEPVAFDLIMKLATSLKGKTTEEILAMNEQLFTKVETTADAELGKMAGTTTTKPTPTPSS